jgi:2-iminobutanoate/2-iminopropanoate deaminase
MKATTREVITSGHAPKPIGPYSVAIRSGGLVFASGQVGLDPKTGELVSGGIEAETRQALTNLGHVLEAAESSLTRVLKTTVFLLDMAEFSTMNSAYASFFPHEPPARSTVAVAALPKGGRVEIDVIAAVLGASGA